MVFSRVFVAALLLGRFFGKAERFICSRVFMGVLPFFVPAFANFWSFLMLYTVLERPRAKSWD